MDKVYEERKCIKEALMLTQVGVKTSHWVLHSVHETCAPS